MNDLISPDGGGFELPEGVRRLLHEALRRHGLLNSAGNAASALKTTTAVLLAGAVLTAAGAGLLTCIVDYDDGV